MGCEVLLRMRNSSVNVKQLDSTVNAVLAVVGMARQSLRRRRDGAPVHLSALEQSVCLLHAVCWCSVDSPEQDASNPSIGRGGRKCLALENEAFAQHLADQCAELVCALLLEEHARSTPILALALRTCAPPLSRPRCARRALLPTIGRGEGTGPHFAACAAFERLQTRFHTSHSHTDAYAHAGRKISRCTLAERS